MISCIEYLIWVLCMKVVNTTIEGIMGKEIQSKQHFATTFRHLTPIIMILEYHGIFWFTLPCLHLIIHLEVESCNRMTYGLTGHTFVIGSWNCMKHQMQ